MRNLQNVFLGLLLGLSAARVSQAVEETRGYSVQVGATVQTAPAQVTLNWPQDSVPTPIRHVVYRKTLAASTWGTGITLPGTATRYVDNNVDDGAAYEYQVVKVTSQYQGYGYIYAGINAPLIESRGKLVLLVDNTCAAELTNELFRLEEDLAGDGWMVLRHDVSRTETVPNIKALIQADYNADKANVQAVFLFGHVPVPYSGNLVPDGHVPGHQGAWPADAYYGDMTGTWTDNSVNITTADDARNYNVPGDGKFDQSVVPGPVALMVGRVDLANLPGQLRRGGPATFPSEMDLLRNYLNKDHRFRHNQMNVPRRAVVGDYFGIHDGEAFAASGWRNFAPLVGGANVAFLPNIGTWLPNLSTNTYLWAYGCGSGSYTSIGGIGNIGRYYDGTTTDLMASDARAVFTLVFGSWLGDWDSQDNLMRTVLALPTCGLASAWSGRPHWFCHHMALGEPIGYSACLTQNNHDGGLYQNQINSAAGNVHIALMGDPTLRMHPVSPPGAVVATKLPGGVSLNWAASADSAVAGYHVYRAASLAGPFTRLTSSLVTDTSFVDSSASSNAALYMVRAVKLEASASGTYFNPSQGVFAPLAADRSTTKSTDTKSSTSLSTTNTVAAISLPPSGVRVVGGDFGNLVP